ncbi:FAD-dependent monooxygenase, partial [Embleya sp. NPDC005575]|uniref:FAD-dependent monooxygenase n=1 Tax=Embleya sp. NPDC005575 TaxID=3156892 RepID=UPI0033BBD526
RLLLPHTLHDGHPPKRGKALRQGVRQTGSSPLLEATAKASGTSVEKLGAAPEASEAPAPRDLSHFAGTTLDAADIESAALRYRLPGPAMEGFMTSLAAIEEVLSERAATLGVEIVRGADVTAVTQDDQTVTVTAAGQRYQGRWLVGCDGGHSTVRTLAGFDFVGTEPLFTGYAAQVTFADPGRLPLGFNPTANGMYLRTPLEGHLGMMDFDGGTFDRSQPLTREHLQTVLRRITGTDATLTEVHLASSFTDRAMQVTTYRRGRVLLAGDAAHIHSPLGGQGLNLGIGDALNLGWKLAAAAHGTAPDGLLDTYTSERHPVGAAVLDWSRAQVATMNPGPNAPALRRLIHDLMSTPDGATHVYRRTSGLFNRYDLADEHPLVGRTAPDFCFEDGTRLGNLLHQGQGVALDFGTHRVLQDAAGEWKGRIRYAAGPVRNDLGFTALLVRPDGVVAWASEHTPQREAFAQATARWFGTPQS